MSRCASSPDNVVAIVGLVTETDRVWLSMRGSLWGLSQDRRVPIGHSMRNLQQPQDSAHNADACREKQCNCLPNAKNLSVQAGRFSGNVDAILGPSGREQQSMLDTAPRPRVRQGIESAADCQVQ